MRKMLSAASVLLLTASAAHAQAPNKPAAEKAIVAAETAVNEAVAKHDTAGFTKYVPGDSWSIDPMGPSQAGEFVKQMAQVKVEPGWKIDGSKFVWINDTTAVHMYHWSGKGTFMGQGFGDTHSSTVWVNRGGAWTAVFHQETPVAPPPKK